MNELTFHDISKKDANAIIKAVEKLAALGQIKTVPEWDIVKDHNSADSKISRALKKDNKENNKENKKTDAELRADAFKIAMREIAAGKQLNIRL